VNANEAASPSEPVVRKAQPNPIALHGASGRLVVTLQRYALTGWIAFFLLLILNVLIVVFSTFAPKPVVVVDEQRRVLGTMEYLNGSNRSDGEVLGAAMYVAQNCLSLNADTIENDVSECMNLMDKPMFDKWLAMLKDGYVQRIKEAGARSTVEFSKDGVRLVSRDGLHYKVRLQGTITTRVFAQNTTTATSREQPFDLTVALTAVPRSAVSTRGFALNDLSDNGGNPK
jgi:hypothetical protein